MQELNKSREKSTLPDFQNKNRDVLLKNTTKGWAFMSYFLMLRRLYPFMNAGLQATCLPKLGHLLTTSSRSFLAEDIHDMIRKSFETQGATWNRTRDLHTKG